MNEDTYVSFRFALLRGSVCGKLSESKAEEWTATLEGANTVRLCVCVCACVCVCLLCLFSYVCTMHVC